MVRHDDAVAPGDEERLTVARLEHEDPRHTLRPNVSDLIKFSNATPTHTTLRQQMCIVFNGSPQSKREPVDSEQEACDQKKHGELRSVNSQHFRTHLAPIP